ncbi:carbohydrate kinase family protein [Patescibacteria group bacterium]|nr:carbohydrate kinase family protein [Patescibacteria group bacterium]
MPQHFDLIVIGDAKIDAFLSIDSNNEHFRLNKETDELCVKLGDKAFVDSIKILPGGNASNVAVSISRLGFKAAIIAEVGTGVFSEKVIKNLEKENVSTDLLKITDVNTCLSLVINYQSERTVLSERIEKENDFDFNNISADWIYITSLSKKWTNAYEKALHFAKTNNIRIAFNPGTAQLDGGFPLIAEIIKNTEILFINKEEAQRILLSRNANFSGKSVEDFLLEIQKIGVRNVVITDGANGSYLIDEFGRTFRKKEEEHEVINRAGAGDSYASGFLAAILAGKDPQVAMEWGSQNAISVISKVGAQAGLLTREEMEERAKRL